MNILYNDEDYPLVTMGCFFTFFINQFIGAYHFNRIAVKGKIFAQFYCMFVSYKNDNTIF